MIHKFYLSVVVGLLSVSCCLAQATKEYYDEEQKLLKGEGVWKFYGLDGKIISEGSYSNGAENGPWKGYYSSGKIALETTYKSGKEQGEWKEFYTNGLPRLDVNYE